jgi:hypothetical protein
MKKAPLIAGLDSCSRAAFFDHFLQRDRHVRPQWHLRVRVQQPVQLVPELVLTRLDYDQPRLAGKVLYAYVLHHGFSPP